MGDSTSVIALLIVLYGLLFWWAFRTLPQESWQFVASMPRMKLSDGRWVGTNLTYYGAWTATAVVFAVAMAIVLMQSVAVALDAITLLAVVLLGLCVPASKILARLIEGKANTFTVGGASMLGLFLAPMIIDGINLVLNWTGKGALPAAAVLAALSVAYAFGEGTGRLACLSFGCCYGVPLQESGPRLSAWFQQYHIAFVGRTKKAAYEGDLEAVPLIPIQALTAVMSVGAGITGVWLFLQGHMAASFLSTIAITQLWRVASEYLRADFRGVGTLSWYQILSLLGVLYAFVLTFWLDTFSPSVPNMRLGLRDIWSPGIILALEALWLGIFFFTGRSRVTASTLTMRVLRDRI